MYLGAEDYYFWLGIECSVIGTKMIVFPNTEQMQQYKDAYEFSYLVGLELTENEYNEMLDEGVDYMKVIKDNYTKQVLIQDKI